MSKTYTIDALEYIAKCSEGRDEGRNINVR